MKSKGTKIRKTAAKADLASVSQPFFEKKEENGNDNCSEQSMNFSFKSEASTPVKSVRMRSQNGEYLDNEFILESCIICQWDFPNFVTSKEKQAHLNYCVDGKGQQHREELINGRKFAQQLEGLYQDADKATSKQKYCRFCDQWFSLDRQLMMNHVKACKYNAQ